MLNLKFINHSGSQVVIIFDVLNLKNKTFPVMYDLTDHFLYHFCIEYYQTCKLL